VVGAVIGNYQLVKKLGEGGMGAVYLGQHQLLGRRAAIKVLLPELSARPDIVNRFFNEARAVTSISDPGIDVAITVPRGLPINAPVEIAITARDRATSRSARTTLAGVVRKPKLCEPGQLTRAQYQAKITELRAAVTAGDLTQAQFDRYDAELVACLK
jgi:serine/threonine protein kinase